MGLVNYSFYSRVLLEQVNIAVLLPTYNLAHPEESLDEVYRKGQKFRTLYVLHGGSDDCTTYIRNTDIERYADEGQFAVVFPEVKLSFYCDMAYGEKFFTYLSKELPLVVQSVFPLSEKREDHFVVGNSMGSHGAFKWALRCPEFFNAAGGMSGVSGVEELGFFRPMGSTNNPVFNAFGSVEEYRESENDMKFLAKKLVKSGRPIPRLFSCCGTEDQLTYEGSKDFAEYAKQIGLPLIWEEGPGKHDWDFWNPWLKRIIDWMGIGVAE